MEGFLPLLCLQLSGYSSRQIVGMGIEGNGQLKETAAKAQREMDKARRILDRLSPSLPRDWTSLILR